MMEESSKVKGLATPLKRLGTRYPSWRFVSLPVKRVSVERKGAGVVGRVQSEGREKKDLRCED